VSTLKRRFKFRRKQEEGKKTAFVVVTYLWTTIKTFIFAEASSASESRQDSRRYRFQRTSFDLKIESGKARHKDSESQLVSS
jgi:hypothetical protein